MNDSTERTPGRVRDRPADFVVEEVSDFQPAGEGEHLALWVEKRGLDHRSMVRRIAQACGVSPTCVGWAGMKDRGAITRQWLTVHVHDGEAPAIDDRDLRVLHADRTARKIRPGQLRGNRFSIRIRGVEPSSCDRIGEALDRITSRGLPNRFMEQRFGHRRINPILGVCLLLEQWQELVDQWLGPNGPPWPDGEQERRDAYAQGQYREAARAWPPHWAAERTTLEHLGSGASPAEAIAEVPRSIRRIWTDAVQAEIFNLVVDRRIAQGTLHEVIDGDIPWRHDRFLEFAGVDESLSVPTGPLWGRRMDRAAGAVDSVECEAVEQLGLTVEQMVKGRTGPGGSRRPLVAPLVDVGWTSGCDGHGEWVEVRFTLPRGAYATAVLDEVIRRDAP